jgi:hypothetical protein
MVTVVKPTWSTGPAMTGAVPWPGVSTLEGPAPGPLEAGAKVDAPSDPEAIPSTIDDGMPTVGPEPVAGAACSGPPQARQSNNVELAALPRAFAGFRVAKAPAP